MHGQHAVQQQPATGLDEGGDPLLGRAAEDRRAGQRERRAGRIQVGGVRRGRAGQVDRAERVAAEQQRPGQDVARTHPAEPLEVADHVLPAGGRRVRVLGQVVVGHVAEQDVVVLLVHVGQQVLGAVGRPHRADHGRERGAATSLGVDRRREAVPFAGERDPVVAVARRLVERRVVAAGEQVVADQPVALGQAEPRLELGRLGAGEPAQVLAVVAGARLELQRRQRLVGVLDGRHEAVHHVEVGHVLGGQLAEVVVGSSGHLRHAGVRLRELADADRERLPAAHAGAVQVHHEGHVVDTVVAGHGRAAGAGTSRSARGGRRSARGAPRAAGSRCRRCRRPATTRSRRRCPSGRRRTCR